MKIKGFTLVLLLSVITATGAWAQNLPAFPNIARHTWTSSIWTSPQSSTTEGRFRSNADDFIRPDAYTGVKFDKWFGMVSFLGATEGTSEMIPTVGFATKVYKVYIGALYTGNLWTNLQANNYTEKEPAAVPMGGEAGKTYDVYEPINVSAAPGNNIALLIGVADMGFRLTYRTNYQSFKESGIVIDNMLGGYTLYKNYEMEEGYIAPQIAWAMAKDLTKNGIRPYFAVDLVFYREYKMTETSGPDDKNNTGKRIVYSKNRFDPSFSLGLGGYTFLNKDGFKFSGDFDYALAFNFYDNEYSYVNGGTLDVNGDYINGNYKTGKIKGTFSENSNPFVEEFFVSNLFTPSISGSWSKDKTAFKFKLNLPLMLSFRDQNSAGLDNNNKLFYKGLSSSTTTFTFRPDLRLSMQYKIIPDLLTLNTGARLQATTLTVETVEQKTYDNDGNEIAGGKQKRHQNSYGSGFISRFNIGITLNFMENAWVEATTGVTNAYGDGAIDIFAPGGLFSFGSILVALKF